MKTWIHRDFYYLYVSNSFGTTDYELIFSCDHVPISLLKIDFDITT